MLNCWISGGKSPLYARRAFEISKKVSSARLTVCGLGQFAAFINGNKVGDHELDPAWTDYRKYIQYLVFDVSELLREGENVLGAEVGNGWYIKTDEGYTFAFPPLMPPNPNPYKPFGDRLIFSAELEIFYADGSTELVDTSENFKTAPHAVTMSNVYGSETIDNRLLQIGWCAPGFDDGAWEEALTAEKPSVPLIEQFQPPVKIIKNYPAELIGEVNGRKIYDLGQNISGILNIRAKGERGSSVKFFPAEKLRADGDVDQTAKNWCEVNVLISCILGGAPEGEDFRMHFSYFAGRFLAVETDAELISLSADAISSAWKTDGSFHCDDERYNKIYNMIEKTVEANMLGVHTDCPTIERFAWQEPNHLMAPSIFYMKDGRRLWEKFLLDMRMAQHTGEDFFFDFAGNRVCPGDGLMPSQAPCYIPNVLPVPGMGSFYDIIPWGSTSILGAWWHYRFYGDEKILRDNYDSALRYLEHLKTKINPEGFINHGLGDWGNPRNELARENIETAFLYADAAVLAEIARILGKNEEKTLRTFAEKVKDNYNKKLLIRHPEKGFLCYRCFDRPDEVFLTQAAQALPLFWGMVPKAAEGEVIDALRYTLSKEGAFICGEVGLPYVIQCARRFNMNDLIAKFITRTEHPSYYAFVLDGETTLGEYWEHNPRSHCHDMMGHIIEWYYNGIAGIIPQTPGFKKVLIRPYLPEGMHSFECSYRSASGLICVSVRDTEENITLEAFSDEGIELYFNLSGLRLRGKNVIIRERDK